jgi:hypothetical protein
MRETLHRYMAEEFRKRLDRSEIDRTLAALAARTNAILRAKYPEAAFEEPSLTPGSYKLVKTGAEKGYTLTYRKPSFKKDKK